jgi:hypothetical protein
MDLAQEPASAFAQMVDKLRTKTDAELKLLYMQFFKDDFIKDWEKITNEADFSHVTDEEIIKAIEDKRYKPAQ